MSLPNIKTIDSLICYIYIHICIFIIIMAQFIKKSQFSSIFTIAALLLTAVVTQINSTIKECPREDAPRALLRALDLMKLNDRQIGILDEIHREMSEILSATSDVPDNFENSLKKRMLNVRIVIWHFKFVIEEAFEHLKRIRLFVVNYGQVDNIRRKFAEEWENLLQKDHYNNKKKFLCLLQGFTHRIMRDETLNSNNEWLTFVSQVAKGIFQIETGQNFDKDNITILTEQEYNEHAKKCEQSEEYSRKTVNNLASSNLNNLIYRLCLHNLISNSEEFQHFLCYHKHIERYKKWMYYLMGRKEFVNLEETFPFILHIEKVPMALRMDAYYAQFLHRTNSESAILHECRIMISQLMGDPRLEALEKLIRQSADEGSPFGRHMLRKVMEVKKGAMARDAIASPKGICMMIKLFEFMKPPNNGGMDLKKVGEDHLLESIDQWWPTECNLRKEAESVFRIQRVLLHQTNRKLYNNLMPVWGKLVTSRGGPTRLHKFLQMNESEIELEWTFDKRYSDPDVFRSAALLETHYLHAFATADTALRKASKLAADIHCWVLWLECEILNFNTDSDQQEMGGRMPRFAIGWKQNRWYYEMVYDQLFDIEKADEEAELEKKRHQIGILLQMSKAFVEQKLKMPDEKRKVEGKQQKMQRLYNGTAQPPNRTVDRDWYEIRRKSEARREKVVPEFELWLQQLHFGIIKRFLCSCKKFNKEFEERSSSNVMRIGQFVGAENVLEVVDVASKCLEKFENGGDQSVDDGIENCHEKGKSTDENKTKISKKLEKADETMPFDVNAALEFVNSESGKKGKTETKNGESRKKKGGKKNQSKNAVKIGTKNNSREKKKSEKVETEGTDKGSAEMRLSQKEWHISPELIPTAAEENNGTSSETAPKEQQEKDNAIEGDGIGERETEGKIVEKDNAIEGEAMGERETEGKIVEKYNTIEGDGIGERETEEKITEKKRKGEKNKQMGADKNGTENGSISGEMEDTNSSTVNGNLFDASMAIQKEFEKIGFSDSGNGWMLFLEDEFLNKNFHNFFTNSSESMRQIVSVGCFINEIGHRMEIIGKLYPIGDQKMLNLFKSLEIAPSKWTLKKLEQNWQQIKRDQLSPISSSKNDHLTTISPIQSDQLEKNNEQSYFGLMDFKMLRKMLCKHLKMITKFVDVSAVDGKSIGCDENDMAFVEQQIGLRKMALAFLWEKKHGNVNEDQFDSNEHKSLLIGTEFELHSMRKFLDHFSLMVEQIKQDQKLYRELSKYLQCEFVFGHIFGITLNLQEIRHFEEENSKLMGNGSDSLDSFGLFLSQNGFGLINSDRKMQIGQAIQEIEQIMRRWNPKAKLLVTGSYQLGVLTDRSDIDAICVVPEMPSWEAVQFFGTKKCELHSDGHRKCADNSLFCLLCVVTKVAMLNRLQDAWMPLIEFKFTTDQGIFVDFDIGLATFAPGEEIFQFDERIKYEQSEALSVKLSEQIEEVVRQRRAYNGTGGGYAKLKEMISEEERLRTRLRSLSGFEVGIEILKKLFATKNCEIDYDNTTILKTYHNLLLGVKMWAKEHHIYDNKLGFFNGISLSILVAKVMLLYPMASLPFLVEKFFLTFSTWPWPTPVKLTDLPDGSALRWTPNQELQKRHEISFGMVAELVMPIVTPGHIEQNATFNVNRSTATLIQREMQRAIRNVRNWAKQTVPMNERWTNVLKGEKFELKYAHFIRVTCAALSLADFYDFCGFVETRIRLQLLMDVEPFEHIRLAHAKKVADGRRYLEQNESKGGNRKWSAFHKIWLVGLELDNAPLPFGQHNTSQVGGGGTAQSEQWVQRLNSMLLHQFNAGIEKPYRTKSNLVGNSRHIQLTSQYEEGKCC